MCIGIPVKDISTSMLDKLSLTDFERYVEYLGFYLTKDDKEHFNEEKSKARKIASLRSLFKYLYKKCNQTNMSRMIIIFFIVTILSSSIATSIFAQNATVADVFYICMIPAILREGKNIYG